MRKVRRTARLKAFDDAPASKTPASSQGESYFFLATLRVFFAVFFTALFAFFAFLAMLPSNVVIWLQFAVCTRESRCTSSRIHQRIQKNSVPLKEVLTRRRGSASRASFDDATRRSHHDARNACVACTDICQDCRKPLCQRHFFDSRMTHILRDESLRESRNVVNGAGRGL